MTLPPEFPTALPPAPPRARAYAVSLDPADAAPAVHEHGSARVELLLAGVRRRWWVLALGGIAGAAVAVGLARLEAPSYRATATLRLAVARPSLAGPLAANEAPEPAGGADPVLSSLQLLHSRGLASRVVAAPGNGALRLRATPTTVLAAVSAIELPRTLASARVRLRLDSVHVRARSDGRETRGAYGDTLVVGPLRLALAAPPGVQEAELVVDPPDVAAGRLLAGITSRPRQGTDVVDVSVDAGAPALATAAVNAVADAFRAMLFEQSRQRLRARVRFIEDRLDRTNASLAQAQDALASFRSRNGAYSTRDDIAAAYAGRAQVEQRRRELAAERVLVRRFLDAAVAAQGGAREDAVRSLAAAMSLGGASDGAFDDLYRQLTRLHARRDSLTRGPYARAPTNPDVANLDALTDVTTQRVLDLARGRVEALDARLESLDGLSERSAGRLRTLPHLEEQEVRLVARVEQLSRTAELLGGEFQRAQLAEAGEDGSIDVIDYALAASTVGMGTLPRAALGGVGGTLSAALLVLVAAARDPSIRRRREILETLRLQELGMIPRIAPASPERLLPRLARAGSRRRRAPTPLADLHSAPAEAYRMVRTNLLYAGEPGRPRTVAITSPLPRDGKTTVACNLAVACAGAHRRVLLVDADTRQPAVHRVFAMPRGPGLLEALARQAPLASLARPTAIAGLAVLPAGSLDAASPDALRGEVLARLLREAAEAYDLVLVDCPPVLLTADSAVVAAHCADVLVVLRAGYTALAAGAHAVSQLESVGAHIVGAVLNNPDGRAEGYEQASYHGEYATTAARA